MNRVRLALPPSPLQKTSFKKLSLTETSQLICIANQLTGFYMTETLAFNGLIFLRDVSSKLFLKDEDDLIY